MKDFSKQYLIIKGTKNYTQRLVLLNEELAKSILNNSIQIASFLFANLVNETMSFDQMYLFYVGKNILNHIRQEKGYKNGAYSKEIKEKFDDEYLFEIVSTSKDKGELESRIRAKIDDVLKEM